MIYHGDLFDVLPTLQTESIDACVTDPPYGLEFMGKEWDKLAGDWGDVEPSKTYGYVGSDGVFRQKTQPLSANIRTPRYHAGPSMQAWHERWAREVFRVLKPGAHLLAFGGTRTYHRMVCAIEDAGFEVRDTISWLYGSGFPKSLNLEEGLGTALKPAHEPIVLARKPFKGGVSANVQKHGTGALNIDACRIGDTVETWPASRSFQPGISRGYTSGLAAGETQATGDAPNGRWPANVCLDDLAAIVLDEQSGELGAGVAGAQSRGFQTEYVGGEHKGDRTSEVESAPQQTTLFELSE